MTQQDGVVRPWKGAVARSVEDWLMRKRDASGMDHFLDWDRYVEEHDYVVSLYHAQREALERLMRAAEAEIEVLPIDEDTPNQVALLRRTALFAALTQARAALSAIRAQLGEKEE